MIDKNKIKAIAFDFGGTLDSPFLHWMDIYLHLYTAELNLPLTRENFRDSYVYAEQMMERLGWVRPSHSLLETQMFKTKLQFSHLIEKEILADTSENREKIPLQAARLATEYSTGYVAVAKGVLAELQKRYVLLLVSNYYGNISKIVDDFEMASLFKSITDSTVAGVRKPDPALWRLAIEVAGFKPGEVLVVGDSMKNDILPGIGLGCQVILGCPESKEKPEGITYVTELQQLLSLL